MPSKDCKPEGCSSANSGRNFCWKYTQRGDLSSKIGRERCEACFGLQVFAYPWAVHQSDLNRDFEGFPVRNKIQKATSPKKMQFLFSHYFCAIFCLSGGRQETCVTWIAKKLCFGGTSLDLSSSGLEHQRRPKPPPQTSFFALRLKSFVFFRGKKNPIPVGAISTAAAWGEEVEGGRGKNFPLMQKFFSIAQKMADWKGGGGKHGKETRYCSPFSKNSIG